MLGMFVCLPESNHCRLAPGTRCLSRQTSGTGGKMDSMANLRLQPGSGKKEGKQQLYCTFFFFYMEDRERKRVVCQQMAHPFPPLHQSTCGTWFIFPLLEAMRWKRERYSEDMLWRSLGPFITTAEMSNWSGSELYEWMNFRTQVLISCGSVLYLKVFTSPLIFQGLIFHLGCNIWRFWDRTVTSSGYMLDCSTHPLSLPLQRLPVNYSCLCTIMGSTLSFTYSKVINQTKCHTLDFKINSKCVVGANKDNHIKYKLAKLTCYTKECACLWILIVQIKSVDAYVCLV